MPQTKKMSRDHNKAIVRLAALKSIDEDLDLGGGLTILYYSEVIRSLAEAHEKFNATVAMLTGLRNTLEEQERVVRDINERMLTGVAAKFGKESSEYGKAGGTRKGHWKKKTKH